MKILQKNPNPDKEGLAKAFTTLAETLQKQGFTQQELKQLITKKETIPATAFNTKLTPLETLTRQIPKQNWNNLNRPKSTLENSYENSKSKHPQEIKPEPTQHHIPIEIFGDRTLSPLEHVCTHLSEEGLKNKEIAELIGKDPRTIWTVLDRAKKKRGEQT